MLCYLVGGAVRDELLGRAVTERDWVVVGETTDAMLRAGFTQVGRDFPVFLHPDTKEEYALARTERKTGPGHTGFAVHADPSVTLEEDLKRRDLTINAIARSEDGRLIDPYDGKRDLEQRTLRHVSDAFAEDPLRIFRLARFAAQLDGFVVAPETSALVREMAAAGATHELPAERVWAEFRKALAGQSSQRFWQVLAELDALAPWFIELADLAPPPTSLEPDDRFVALGTQLTPDQARELGSRLKTPNDERALIVQAAEYGERLAALVQAPGSARGVELLAVLQATGALRQGNRFDRLLLVLSALVPARANRLAELHELVVELRAIGAAAVAPGLVGKAVGEAISAARRVKIESWLA